MKKQQLKISLLTCSFLFAFSILSSPVFSSSKGFEELEDKATVPLLNPSLAERKVAKLKLDNGLQVFLISDPGADQSAAGMAIEAGSWQDPKEYPGMAHFCEHMLFMGTATYPVEFEYMQYIRDNGGNVNASTWPDRTIYMFSINNDAFEGALDRFSHFFIDPLFSPSCINRELHAVDQEHSKNIENDGWRQYMIFKETGNQEHPNASFSTGNAATLSGIPQAALKQWYESHYSANRMHLVLISPLPLETLTNLVLQDFSKVPNRNVAEKTFTITMTSPEQRGHIIYIKPIKDLRILSLVWELPVEYARDTEHWAPQLAAYALGNEGDNSLLSQLKKEKLAEGINVSADRYGKNQQLFNIDITLTEQGLTQIDSVLSTLFQAIAKFKETGIPSYIFDDMKKTTLLQYQYQSRDDAFSTISQHAHDLVDEELQTYPIKTLIPTSYDPEYISSFLQTLKPENCLFFVMADPLKTKVAPDHKEKWMGAEYAVKAVPHKQLLAWADSAPSSQIDLPEQNPFLPSHLSLVDPSVKLSEDLVIPTPVLNDESGKVFFAQDHQYMLPEFVTIFGFKTPLIDGTARSSALSDLYIKALTEKLSSPLFFAQSAGINASFGQKNLKFTFAVNGYSEKAPLLIKEISDALKHISPSKEQFEIYRHSLLSSYDNASKELPVLQAISLLNSVITNDSPTSQEKHAALSHITYEDFQKFSKALFQTSYMQGLIYGNIKEQDAQSLSSDIKASLGSTPYPLDKQNTRRVLVLSEKQGPYLVAEKTERQGNGIVLLLEEGPFSFERRAASQLLSIALHEGFFDTLRTKQQTAYWAKGWDSEIEKQLLQYFAVQSSTHQPRDLLARFELFLEDFTKSFSEKLSPERFENIRKMLVITLEMPPENMQGKAVQLNTLAFDYDADFHWIEKRIAGVKALSYEQLTDSAEEMLSRQNTKRLAILMEGVSPSENDFRYRNITKEKVSDLGNFVSWK